MFPIRFSCFSSSASTATWPQILVKWLGHLISYCTSNLTFVIQRVSYVANERFSPKEPQETADLVEEKDVIEQSLPSPKDNKIGQKQTNDTEEDEAAIADTDSEAEAASKESADEPQNDQNQPPREAQKISEPLQDLKLKEEDPVLDLDEPLESEKIQPPARKSKEKSANPPIPRRHYLPKEKEARSKDNPLPRKLAKPPAKAQPKLPAVPSKGAVKAKPEANKGKRAGAPSAQDKFKVIDCGGSGDCQLLSLLEGLKRKHPKLAKDEKGKLYEHLDLRRMGVNFAREQINAKGPYHERILGYLEIDREEFNEDVVAKVKNDLRVEMQRLDKNREKIPNASYEKQKQALQLKFGKKEADVKKTLVIRDNEEYLKRLENKGFDCSTLHLFALSVLLEVPIYVHEKGGAAGHDFQVFNPTASQLDPVRLLHLKGGHYQLIVS